eukprot:GAHX01001107.1.p1 GENE.GAHX01001107.1~~GAHX01001107.1.p1  ORF type:complete len:355 (+),score=58.78 GAHX01001107.1:39-1067(+)
MHCNKIQTQSTSSSHSLEAPQCSSIITSKRVKAFDNILSSSDTELISLSFSVLKSKVSNSQLSIPDDNLLDLIKRVSTNYYKNPYHTFKHGVDVMLSLNQFLNFLPFSIKPEETIFLLLIALNHDILHPGCSNKCMAKKNPMLPIITDTLSVNEMVSIKKCTELIKETKCFENVNLEQQKVFFELLNKTILATDIENAEFNEKLNRFMSGKKLSDKREERTVQFSVLLRLADVSNCLFAEKDCVNWSYRLYLEINNKKLHQCELKENIMYAFEYQVGFLSKYIKETVKSAVAVNAIKERVFKDLDENVNLLVKFFEEHRERIKEESKIEEEIEKILGMITWI